jgi:excisionase family DNA binding protein
MSQVLTDPAVLRIPDLAKILNTTELNCRRMIERGQVPARRLGRRVIILRAELEVYLKGLPVVR